jgi:hypothetical protein
MSNSELVSNDRRNPAGIPARGFQSLSDRQLIAIVGGRSLAADTSDGSLSLPAVKHFDSTVGIDVHMVVVAK